MKVLFFLLIATSAFAMNRLQYNDLMLGTRGSAIVNKYGDPYSVRDLGNGTLEYEYVERISMNNELVYENHYILTIVNGQLVNKRIRQENRPPYDQMYQENPNYPSYP